MYILLHHMRTILVGSQRHDPTTHIVDIIEKQITTYDQRRSIRVYFFDHRADTRMGMTDYIIEGDSNMNFDVTYKVSNCTAAILSELAEDMMNEARYSNCRNTILLYFDLDSIDSIDQTVINSILSNFQNVSDVLALDLICLSTSKFLDAELLNRFDQIHILKEATTSSDDDIIEYLVQTDRWCEPSRLNRLIMMLDIESVNSIELKDLRKMMESDVSKYGRIVVT
jgi:hypothetical protein